MSLPLAVFLASVLSLPPRPGDGDALVPTGGPESAPKQPSPRPRTSDEAVLLNGTTLAGKLNGDKTVFFTDLTGKKWAFDELQQVRFAEVPCPLPPLPLRQRLMLPGDQWISGQLLSLDEASVRFRCWAGKELTIARKDVAAVAQPDGWQILSRHRAVQSKDGWTFSDSNAVRKNSLILDRPRQEAAWTAAAPVKSARVCVFLKQSDDLKGQELRIRWNGLKPEAHAKVKMEPHSLEIVLDGTSVRMAKMPPSPSLKSTPGWHLLQADFSGKELRISVDDLVLHTEPAGQGCELTGFKFHVASKDDGKPAGYWSIADVQIMRAAPVRPWPKPLAVNDILWLADADQLFGNVIHSDGGSVAYTAPYGKRTLPWSSVRGIIFKADQDRRHEPAAADSVTLWAVPAPGYAPDRITAALLSVSEQSLTLRHPTLGELSLDRKNCVRLARHGRPK